MLKEVPSNRSAKEIDATDLAGVTAATVVARHPELSGEALQLAFNFKRAATALVQREEFQFATSTNRSVAAVRALTMIWMFEPVEARDLAVLSGLTRQAISGVLTTLERDGLISKERGLNADRRLAPVSITSAGSDLLDQILPQQNEIDSEFFSVLTKREQQQLIALTKKLVAGMGARRRDDAVE